MATKKTAKKTSISKTRSSSKKKPAKKSSSKSKLTRKYSPSAGKNVEREMKEMKKGTLKTSTGRKVTNRKQAIAIGLSEARKAGKKVPPKKS